MVPRRDAAAGHDSDTTEYDSETMKCLSCGEDYDSCYAGTCKECYKEASETKAELKREMKELKAKVAFLRFCSPFDRFTDVVLVASDGGSGGGPVPAHKAVLASRSPVFERMFKNEMKESRRGTVKISDVTYDALQSFIDYLYTAEAELDEQMARDLLVLAEKYEVKHLKTHCEEFMVSKLNWDNSVRSYAFAHLHKAKHLLSSALLSIIDNMDKLAEQDEYKELVEKDAKLVVGIYEAYMSKQVKKGAPKKP